MIRKTIATASIFISVVFMSCQSSKTPQMEKELSDFIKQHETQIIPLSVELGKAWYDAAISGKKEDYERAANLNVTLTKIYTNKNDFEKLKKMKESGAFTDSLLARQLELLYLRYLGNQVDTAKLEEAIRLQSNIENQFSSFRAVIDGKPVSDNKIDSIIRNSKNSKELETTWKASKEIGQAVSADLLVLVKKRNAIAKELGFGNYQEMSFKLGEQDPEEIEKLFDELDELTRNSFMTLKGEIDSYLSKRFSLPVNQLMPWHYQNRFFQEAPAIYSTDLDKYYETNNVLELTKKYYAGLGIPVDDILNRSDLYEKDGKNQHAFCTDIDRNGDVRVLMNIRNDSYWMNTSLHELGHGVYSKYNDPQMPYLLRDAAHPFTTEAIAMMFGRFYANPSWIKDNIGISDVEKNVIALDCKNTLRLEQLVFSRWAQVMFRFEKSLYENPDQDLNKLWWDLVEKYQMLKRPEGRNSADWASKIHIATVPCYYHNYLMGELLASQLYYHIGEKILKSANPEDESFTNNKDAGKFLVDKVFKPGLRYTWNDMIEHATGEKLTAKYYARQFVK